ncbi:hypothetical protein [Aliivibrio finisterrensis]|uniref:DUF4402 domain-containing protein n=2 Tax=Vibrionaceae TaxID=641 RepID=A0A4Q5L2X5_9GAMM|nr:hypothetical protein [Aliivibrio finisterrensis]RYU55034.1 hypothetical protein ERW57_00490 [Aliivibrio finisterrensis]RYU56626.1 hypothetical protein ERW56_00170 [Aliivibrio finisterrensis]RYU61747.1 hypothetical protein ERW50_00170 [Aliivibrio finisterrensis]RYU66948.1 hypothetical protein ERW53_01680 [Aliivibrio finisterrensis]RYU88730.1 hypothetical protein ERW52_01880 [Aliivibrio finisterrensis]
MTNFKKNALVTLAGLGMVMSAGAYAATNAQATLVWSGTVPGALASDSVVITGLNGIGDAFLGSISPSTDGTFVSSIITAESHTNDGDATTPVVGALVATNWTLVSADVAYDGVANPAATVEVQINGAPVAVGDPALPGLESVGVSIAQTTPLDEADVAGAKVQGSVTLLSSLI